MLDGIECIELNVIACGFYDLFIYLSLLLPEMVIIDSSIDEESHRD